MAVSRLDGRGLSLEIANLAANNLVSRALFLGSRVLHHLLLSDSDPLGPTPQPSRDSLPQGIGVTGGDHNPACLLDLLRPISYRMARPLAADPGRARC